MELHIDVRRQLVVAVLVAEVDLADGLLGSFAGGYPGHLDRGPRVVELQALLGTMSGDLRIGTRVRPVQILLGPGRRPGPEQEGDDYGAMV